MELACAAHALVLNESPDIVAPFFRLLSNSWRVAAKGGVRSPDWRAVFDELEPSAVEFAEARRKAHRKDSEGAE
jgi:hypothetical protein